MSVLYFDTSALAKRYMPETGTNWVRKQTASHGGNDVVIAQITPIELYSAIARQYHDSQIDRIRLIDNRKRLSRSGTGETVKEGGGEGCLGQENLQCVG